MLDAEQQQCVHDSDMQHVLIQAVPGSGKTRTMAAKCKDLVDNGVDPASITVVTFTNKAAEEIKSRINVATLVCGTFHAVALQVLQQQQYGVFDDDVTIVTDPKAPHSFFTSYLKDHCVQLHKHASAVVKAYNLFRTSREDDADVQPIGAVPASVLLTCFRAYQTYKRQHHLIDFDDLLHDWHEFITTTDTYTLNTRYLLVDEVQDCNNIQFDIIRAFARHGTRVVAVGDADQSIYAFRGANVRHIQDFADTLPDTQVLTLHRNYRSTPEICHVAQCIIDFNSGRSKKPMQSMNDSGPVPVLYPFKHVADELQFVAATCQRALHEQLECAVLCRTNKEVDEVCKTLQHQHVQYSLLRGTNLFDKPHVQLLVGLLTFVFSKDPPDAVMLDLFVAHKHMTKPTALELLRNLQADTELNSLVEVFLHVHVPPPVQPLRAVLQPMRNALQQVHAPTGTQAYSAYGQHIMAVVMMYLRDTFQYTLEQMHDVRQVDTMREGYKTFDLFLKAVQLGAAQVKASGGSVVLVGTLHQAKSLEFECVIITGCANGSIPSFLSNNSLAEVEEERRLLYVGATRAKQQLCFTFAVHSSFDKKEEKPRQLSYLLAPFVNMLVTKQHAHLLPPPLPSTFATLTEAVSNFYRSFGKYNLLAAVVKASVADMEYYLDFMSEPPCELAPDFPPSPLHAAIMRNLLQSFLLDANMSLQTRVQQVASQVLGAADPAVGSVCLTMRTRKWVQVLHDMQAFAQRLLAAEPSPLMVRKKVVHKSNRYDCTVDVLVSRSLFCVVYDAEPPVASLLNVYLTAALLAPSTPVTTLVFCNLYTGTLHRQPFKPLPCDSLPMSMQAHPVIQLLLATPVQP